MSTKNPDTKIWPNIHSENEYISLKQEHLKRLEIHYQLVFGMIVISGLFLWFSAKNDVEYWLLSFLLPILLAILLLIEQRNSWIRKIIWDYIIRVYESDKQNNLGWESHFKETIRSWHHELSWHTSLVVVLISGISLLMGSQNQNVSLNNELWWVDFILISAIFIDFIVKNMRFLNNKWDSTE